MTSGWLLDTYSAGDRMVSWMVSGGSVRRVEEEWTPSIYVACDERRRLGMLATNGRISEFVRGHSFVEKQERAADGGPSEVLRLELADSSQMVRLARAIDSVERFGTFRLYNVDVPPDQSYIYEKEIFPFGKFRASGGNWTAMDDPWDTDYEIPEVRAVQLRAVPRKEGRIARFSDKIGSIQVGTETIERNSEEDAILDLVDSVRRQDPDVIFTDGGDLFDMPYLAHRALQAGIQDRLVLGRDGTACHAPGRQGTSYFSYGRMHFKPAAYRLCGRIHIDRSSCFIWEDDYSMHGLYEIARVCRMPMQTACRASIGKCMSSLQFYNAARRGLLVPWRPTMAEAFKTRRELLVGDRGGLVFEPQVGVHEGVAEIDFASLFGNIMEKRNISAETILCACCPDSENRVPELGYNICRKTGIVPQSLGILLGKRRAYGQLLKKFPDNRAYEARKSALKWILVTSFGYLGFNNAKFGRIDAHMAVCAFARQLLLRAARIAEARGFEVLHGIVDSLWLSKRGSTREEMECLGREIEGATGFEVSLDIYKWVAFLSSRRDRGMPVANRYFGAFDDGSTKVRGIEMRRHDTPAFFKRCQAEMLDLMASADTIGEVQKKMPDIVSIYRRYRKKLEEGTVPAEDLAFTTRASKDAAEYTVNSVQRDAIVQLGAEGEPVRAGQSVRYVIADHGRRTGRTRPLAMGAKGYDVRRYARLLAECCNTITSPFGTAITPGEHPGHTLG